MGEQRSICKKLVNSKTISLDDMSKFPDKPGIYMILHSNEPLYAGQTKNIQRRLQEHLSSGKQEIGKYLAKVQRQNEGKGYYRRAHLSAKYQECFDPSRFERAFISCIEDIIGKPLPYNKTGGNTR